MVFCVSLGGIALLPFTGGGSAIAIAHGLTAGGITISTTEIFVGAGLLLSASSLLLLKNYEVEFESNKSSNSKSVKLKLKPNKKWRNITIQEKPIAYLSGGIIKPVLSWKKMISY